MKTFEEFLEEAWGKDTYKAYRRHGRLMRKLGNKSWPMRHVIASVAAAPVVSQIMTHGLDHPHTIVGGLASAALGGIAASRLGPHIRDIQHIRNLIKRKIYD